MAPIWMSLAVVTTTAILLLLLFRPSRYVNTTGQNSVQIVVLGDVGRSPRMQYHAASIANYDAKVELIGFLDTDPLNDLVANVNVRIVPLSLPPKWLQTSNKLLFLAFGPLKVLLQVWSLFNALAYRTEPSRWMIVQNPPSIPTLFIAAAVCWVRGTRLIIDWHNFGFSILALKLGNEHPLVRISYAYEFLLGRLAFAHITVTNAMGHVLRSKLGPNALIMTLHDRPARIFQPTDEQQRLAFLQRYSTVVQHYSAIADGDARLLVSSTSWTPDEDFSIFLDALCQYSKSAQADSRHLPDLVVIITGKGSQKQYYVDRTKKLKAQGMLEKVSIYTDWLSFHDYASLLAAADLGISLHTSSSGVDLPMKVVDMFGAGLPVLGWSKFAAWPELVTEGVNGRGFGNADEMAIALRDLFQPNARVLATLKQGALQESKRRWDHEWTPVLGKLLEVGKVK